jgi:hypothetical protein
MKPAEGFLSAKQAAAYVGYQPAPERAEDGTRNTAREDPQMRAFYAWASNHGVTKHRRGRCLLFTRVDLDRAIGRSTDEHDDQRRTRMERMAQLARQHAAGEDVHA